MDESPARPASSRFVGHTEVIQKRSSGKPEAGLTEVRGFHALHVLP
jgi:hypothetical protein